MPIYEYECDSCGYKVEQYFSKMSAAPQHYPCAHGHCQGTVRRLMSAPKFRIKGYSEANGYNLPSQSDVLDADGYAKTPDKWGK